jgi:hypothetical protein
MPVEVDDPDIPDGGGVPPVPIPETSPSLAVPVPVPVTSPVPVPDALAHALAETSHGERGGTTGMVVLGLP